MNIIPIKYIIDQNNVDTLNQIPYGQGWVQVKRELESTFRAVTQLGYAVLFISHDKDKTFKRQDGTEYNQVVPTLSNSLCSSCCKRWNPRKSINFTFF